MSVKKIKQIQKQDNITEKDFTVRVGKVITVTIIQENSKNTVNFMKSLPGMCISSSMESVVGRHYILVKCLDKRWMSYHDV